MSSISSLSVDLNLVRSKPVAQFFYKGNSHSHHVRRTVLVMESNKDTIKGYEIREGNEIRDIDEAPVKTFRIDRMATTSQLRKDNPLYNKKNTSTYTRMGLSEINNK